ncbi:MAG: AAA family ATPase, partial [Chloroflexi bacterium]|nr:AAA family ATPase [Chloroflexota bacterium]
MNCPRCGFSSPNDTSWCPRCGEPLPGPPLVGRAGELTELQVALRALQAGQGGIVSVIGGAGLGKTRLATELYHRAEPADPPVRWLTAACSAVYPPEVPGLDLATQLLQAYVGPTADPVGQLDQALRAQLPHEAEFIQRYLGRLLEVPAVPPQIDAPAAEPGQRHVFEAFTRWLTALTQESGLVLLIDDLQWIGPSSAALLEHAWPLIQRQPILFLLLYEPAEDRRCWELRRQAANLYADSYHEVFLHPLSEDHASQLVDREFGSGPAEARQAIVRLGAGNPLLLHSLTRWWRQAGPAHPPESDWPATLPQVAAAQIDLLPPEARRVLQLAAVVGPILTRRLLAQVLALDGPGEGALQHLQRIQALGLIRPFPGRDHAYTLAHDVVYQAAYASLSPVDQAHAHALAAQAIEQRAGPEQAASLARHYMAAVQPERALPYVQRACDQALWRYADEAAMVYCQAGLAVAASPDLWRRMAVIQARRGQWIECVQLYERVLSTQADDPQGQAETYQAIAEAHRHLGDRESEGYYIRKALSVLPADGAQSAGAPALHASLLLAQSGIAWAHGDRGEALAPAQQALSLAQQADDVTLIVMAWNQIGGAHVLVGDDALAQEAFLQALDGCEALPVRDEARLRTYLNAGTMHVQIVGDLAMAQHFFTRALDLAQRLGHDTWTIWAHLSLANLAFVRGDWGMAQEHVQQAQELGAGRNLAAPELRGALLLGQLLRARGQAQTAYERFRQAAELAEAASDVVQGLIPARVGQAQALWDLERPEPALLLLEQTLHLCHQEGTPESVAVVYGQLVRCLLARGQTVAARRIYDDVTSALTLARPWVQAQDAWLRGLLAAAEGQAAAAEHDLRVSQRAWQRRGYPYQEGQVLLDLARFYLAQERPTEALQSRDEAIALFQLLGAAGDLARAEALA